MKRLELLLAAVLAAAMCGCSSEAEFRLASYNIRYDAPADAQGGDAWDDRKGSVAELLLSHEIGRAHV